MNSLYSLPEINFVGGESKVLQFNLLTVGGNSFDASDCKVGFAIINYCGLTGEPAVTKEASIVMGDDGVNNIVSVELVPEDTISLYGKFVYQITLLDHLDRTEIPSQGIMNIARNIHPQFITRG